jgi:hypothetical protein
VFLWRFRLFRRQRDVVVAADVFEGFTTKGVSLERGAKLGKVVATGTEITVEGGVGYIGQNGQF